MGFFPLKDAIAEVMRSNMLFENQPKYEPPYVSPLEDLFAWNLAKRLSPQVRLHKQVEAATLAGTFKSDFVVESKPGKVAFECDGEEFHDVLRDEWRDAMILGEGHVDTIYRLRGRDLVYHIEDCLYVISRLEPQIFSKRGIANIETLASNSIKTSLDERMSFDKNLSKGSRLIVLDYLSDLGYSPPPYIYIVRETRHIPEGENALWKSQYNCALESNGLPLDSLIEKYHRNIFK